MYAIYIYAYIGVVWGANVGIYGIHGVYGIYNPWYAENGPARGRAIHFHDCFQECIMDVDGAHYIINATRGDWPHGQYVPRALTCCKLHLFNH